MHESRMIGTLAIMGGCNLNDDEVQTLVYMCLVESSIGGICKQTGMRMSGKSNSRPQCQ